MTDDEMVDAMERHAEHINGCHGIDPRHMLLIQAVRELVAACRRRKATHDDLLAMCEEVRRITNIPSAASRAEALDRIANRVVAKAKGEAE